MDAADVLIVGGGPAGSTCGGKLCNAGVPVLLLDKSPFPRAKPCAGWITPQVVEDLQLDIDEYRVGRVWQPIHGFRIGLIGGSEVDVVHSRPISFGIRRCEFDTYLLDRSGVRCELGVPVRTIERRASRWVVNDRFSAAILVGAGGHFCPVARLLGARRNPAASVVAAQEVEFVATRDELRASSVRPEIPELFFCRDLAGYGWCFRKGNHINIGLGRLDSRRLSAHVRQFCEFLQARKRFCGRIPKSLHGHAYQLYERIQPKLFDDGVLLVGDAAGLAYPQSGEGIRPAVESGLIAADVVLAAAASHRSQDLAQYQPRIVARFGKSRSAGLIDWLPATLVHNLAKRLMATRWFAEHVVVNRWFLHNVQAPLELSP